MSRILLIIGGVLNLILAAFHVLMAFNIPRIKEVPADYRVFMMMLDIACIVAITLFSVASLFYIKDMMSSKLGKLIMFFVFLFYISRGIEEIAISPVFSPLIFAVCAIISLIYLALMFLTRQRQGDVSQ
jgi:hypothetical protein